MYSKLYINSEAGAKLKLKLNPKLKLIIEAQDKVTMSKVGT